MKAKSVRNAPFKPPGRDRNGVLILKAVATALVDAATRFFVLRIPPWYSALASARDIPDTYTRRYSMVQTDKVRDTQQKFLRKVDPPGS